MKIGNALTSTVGSVQAKTLQDAIQGGCNDIQIRQGQNQEGLRRKEIFEKTGFQQRQYQQPTPNLPEYLAGATFIFFQTGHIQEDNKEGIGIRNPQVRLLHGPGRPKPSDEGFQLPGQAE